MYYNEKNMKAKLYKTEKENYVLVDPTKGTYDDGYMLGTSRESQYNKLSIKNCQAIECGYDLDELAEEWCMKPENNWSNNNNEVGDNYGSYKEGFQKALEILGDKKFTKEDMGRIMVYGYDKSTENEYLSRIPFDEYIQSLQQTEWDVIIEMEPYHDGDFINDGKTHIIEAKLRYRLDSDGCLILKRK